MITRRRENSSAYDSNDDYDINENRYDNNDEDADVDNDEDDEETRDSAEDYDDFSDENSAKKSNSVSDSDSTVEDDMGAANAYGDSDEEKYRKLTYKLPLDSIEYSPYLAINNQKLLKWKFLRHDESDWQFESCSFKIYSCVSKNFHSAYYLLDELIDQLDIKSFQQLNELWNYLIKISCAQVFNKRLKLLNLLIKIMHKVNECSMDKMCVNLFALKPLKNLEYTLEMTSKEDRNLSRALFELFFFAEKLANKWQIQNEYRAQMKDKVEFVEKVCETAYLISLIMTSLNLSTNSSEPSGGIGSSVEAAEQDAKLDCTSKDPVSQSLNNEMSDERDSENNDTQNDEENEDEDDDDDDEEEDDEEVKDKDSNEEDNDDDDDDESISDRKSVV